MSGENVENFSKQTESQTTHTTESRESAMTEEASAAPANDSVTRKPRPVFDIPGDRLEESLLAVREHISDCDDALRLLSDKLNKDVSAIRKSHEQRSEKRSDSERRLLEIIEKAQGGLARLSEREAADEQETAARVEELDTAAEARYQDIKRTIAACEAFIQSAAVDVTPGSGSILSTPQAGVANNA